MAVFPEQTPASLTALAARLTAVEQLLATEQAARAAGDADAGGDIAGESAARGAAVTALDSAIEGEQAARITAFAQVDGRVGDEILARVDADEALSDRIDGEQLARGNEVVRLDGRIDGEASVRTAAIAAEAAARTSLQALLINGAVGGAPTIMSSRASLQALGPGAVGRAVLLSEYQREGVFAWSGDNLAALVSIDTAKGIIIPPASDTSGANGAWVRVFSDQIEARWFGAVGDGVTLDSAAVMVAHNMSKALDRKLNFRAGTYRVVGWNDTASFDPVHWCSDDGAIIKFETFGLTVNPAHTATFSLSGDSLRDQNVLNVVTSSGINIGAIITLITTEVVDTQRNVGKKQAARVIGKTSTTLLLDAPLNFDFSETNAGLTARYYNGNRKILFEGLDIRCSGAIGPIVVSYIRDQVPFRNCRFVGDYDIDAAAQTGSEGPQLTYCSNVRTEGCHVESVRYGIKFLACSKSYAINTTSYRTRHPAYFAEWSYDVGAHYLVGQQNTATIDSHEAIRVDYSHVRIAGDAEIGNLRSAGGTLRDVRMATRKNGTSAFVLGGCQWVAGYVDRFKAYDFIVEDVDVTYLDGIHTDLISLSVAYGRNVIINRFNTSTPGVISAGNAGRIGEIIVDDSNFDWSLINAAAPFDHRMRNPIRYKIGRPIDAVSDGGGTPRYLIRPFPKGLDTHNRFRCRGNIIAEGASSAGARTVPVRLFTSHAPLGFATGFLTEWFELEIIATCITSTGYDRISHRYFLRHARSGPVIMSTTPFDIQGPASQTGDGLTLALQSPVGQAGAGTGGVDWVGQYVDFDLVVTPPSSGACRLDYKLVSGGVGF